MGTVERDQGDAWEEFLKANPSKEEIRKWKRQRRKEAFRASQEAIRAQSDEKARAKKAAREGVVGSDLTALTPRMRSLVEPQVRPGEQIRFCLVGLHEQSLIALSDRLIVAKAGFLAGATFGGRVTSFDFSDISGVQVNTGLVTGTIEIHTPGLGATKASDFWSLGEKEDPAQLPNTIPIAKPLLTKFQPYIEELKSLVAEAKRGGAQSAPPASGLAEELSRLQQFHEAGALSAEEYQAAKAKLLGM